MFERWRIAVNRLDLQGKIMIALLAAALAMGGIVTLGSYMAMRYMLVERTRDLLSADLQLEQNEIELRLANVVALAESVARNPETQRALEDSDGRTRYLDPLLRNQILGVGGAVLSVVDDRGHPVAGTRVPASGYGTDRQYLLMMGDGLGKAEINAEINGKDDRRSALLQVALPIRDIASGSVAGGVMLRVPLDGLLGATERVDARWITDGDGRRVAGTELGGEVFDQQAILLLPAPLDSLGLRLTVARDRNEAFKPLDVLLLTFIGIGLIIVGGLIAFSRVGARHIAAPLREIASAAEEIASSGRPTATLPINRHDEFGRLAGAFNTMVTRLRASYGELETAVAERTRDYEESKEEAERISNLLREAIQHVAVGFTIYDDEDRLVDCNEAYLRLYEESRDLIVPGATFESIVRAGAERGQYAEAVGCVDEWVAARVRQHRNANGVPIEQRLGDGRWLLIVEHRTPSGYIVGNRIDITELKKTSETLRLRDLYQRATLDNLPFFFWLKDAEGRFLAANRVYAAACGIDDPEALVGKTVFDVWPRQVARRYDDADRAVLESGNASSSEEEEQSGCWIESYRRPVVNNDGTVIGTVGFARDITERKYMERALALSEQRFDLAVRGANDGVWDWNTVTGEASFSPRWKAMLGYADDEIGGDIEEWRSLVHPDDLPGVLKKMEEHLAGRSDFYAMELRMRCRDGSYKWILCRGKALFDETGNPARMSGSHTDISDQRAAEAAIRERNEQLNAIFALSPDGFVSFDGARCVKYVSPAFRRMTGISESRVVGLDEDAFSSLLADACIPEARFPGLAALRAQAAIAEGAADPGSTDTTAGSRQLIEMAGAGKRVIEVGVRTAKAETVSQVLYLRDVTHETEVDRMKSEFLSTAAHELRTPMACIFGFSELLLHSDDFAPEERGEFLSSIYKQSELMIAIVNELLDLARIEARRGKDFEFAETDACALLREVLGRFMAPGGRAAPVVTGVDCTFTVRADRNKLTQAINNVLSNAYKYSPGGGEVRVGIIGEGAPEGSPTHLGIRVTDHGIGMTEAQLARVFERFFRADTSGKIPGTGLGMSIVKEIVELHGGHVQLKSEAGAGTMVTLWIPYAAPAQPVPQEVGAEATI